MLISLEIPDKELMESARSGDREAMELLLQRYESRVYRFSLKMCRNEEDAREVLQETLLALSRHLSDFRGDSSLSTWLYTVARSFCIKLRRRSKFAPERLESLDGDARTEVRNVASTEPGPEDEAQRTELSGVLDEAIRTLSPGYREVLLLRDVEGFSASEVAEITNLSVEAVKSRLHRARVAVRKQVGPLLGIRQVDRAPGAEEPCLDVVHLFSRQLEGDLHFSMCEKMQAHLRVCSCCKSVCDSCEQQMTVCRGLDARVPCLVQDQIRELIWSDPPSPASKRPRRAAGKGA